MEETNRSSLTQIPLSTATATATATTAPPPLTQLPSSATAGTGLRNTNYVALFQTTAARGQVTIHERIKSLLLRLTQFSILFLVFLCIAHLILARHPKFGLNSLSVSSFNVSGSEITADWDVEFLARNPNALLAYSYKSPILSVFFEDHLLSEAVLPRIHLSQRKRRFYVGKSVALSKRIDDSRVVDAIAMRWSEGVLPFTIRLLDTSPDYHREIELNVTCGGVKVGFSSRLSSRGRMLGENLQPSPNSSTDQQAFTRCTTFSKS